MGLIAVRVYGFAGIVALLGHLGCEPNCPPSIIRPPEDGRIPALQPETMTTNQIILTEVAARTQAFYVENEPQRLVEAWLTLEGVGLSVERDADVRTRVRATALDEWLRLLSIVDAHVDPRFDRSKVPGNLVAPPKLPGGVVYPGGAVDPAEIPDPAERAKYEDAIAKNNAAVEYYETQISYHRLDERITPSAETFIRDAYTSEPRDQAELRAAIDQVITNPARKAALSKLLSPQRP